MRRVLLLASLLLVLTGLAFFGAWVKYVLVPELDTQLARLETYHPPVVAHVFDAYGQPFDTLLHERRYVVPLSDIAPVMRQAIISAEDRRFYRHPGVDLKGILRAVRVNLERGGYEQGGSTLTQQLIKHLVVGHEQSLDRKLREAMLALRLEQRMEKDRILELYLNYVYLGEGNYGVEAAARDYFGKPARALNLPEAAALAALLPSPSAWSPRDDPAAAQRRRDLVIQAMEQEGYISAGDAEIARYSSILALPRQIAPDTPGAAYRTEVRRAVQQYVGEQVLFDEGLAVHTAYDPFVQQVAEQAVAAAAHSVERRKGHIGMSGQLSHETWALFFSRAPGLERTARDAPIVPAPGDCFPAAFKADKAREIYAGPYIFRLSDAAWEMPILSREVDPTPRPLSEVARAGQLYHVCKNASGEVDLAPDHLVQGAAVVIDNATGAVVAMVGGVGMPLQGFNRATQALRQPGSAFKPIVYAAALEAGWKPSSQILDAPITIGSGRGAWSPHNYSDGYRGVMSLSSALALSANTAAVRLGMRIGLSRVRETARRLGIERDLGRNPTLLLGSEELSVLELTIAFASFARDGLRTQPNMITHITNPYGGEVGRAGGRLYIPNRPWQTLPGNDTVRAISSGTARQMREMLRGVVRSGTARSAYKAGSDRAGKTGTSSDFADAWFVGMIPTHTIGVWLGCDSRMPLGEGESGGKAALPAWVQIVEALEARQRSVAAVRLAGVSR